MTEIGIGGFIKQGWGLARKKPFTLFFSALIFFIYNWFIFLVLLALDYDAATQYFFATIFSFITAFFVTGLLRTWIAVVDGEKFAFKLFSGGFRCFKVLSGGVAYFLIVIIGMYLLIIPGIIWAIKYQFIFHIIVDKKISIVQAFKKSARMTKGRKWDLLLFGAALSLINICGILCFGVGFIVTILWTAVAYTHMYRRLSSDIDNETGIV